MHIGGLSAPTPLFKWDAGIWRAGYMIKLLSGLLLTKFLVEKHEESSIDISTKRYTYQLNQFPLADGFL